jgi:hypothetical protein
VAGGSPVRPSVGGQEFRDVKNLFDNRNTPTLKKNRKHPPSVHILTVSMSWLKRFFGREGEK